MKKVVLALADGTLFYGKTYDHTENSVGEVVFNTQMVGYQKIMTDPSYIGQIVVMTYPLIGNYGVNADNNESTQPWVKGMIVREICDLPSNFRMESTINSFADSHGIPLVWGIDTRALTKHIRDNGSMNGVIVVDDQFSFENYRETLANYEIKNAAEAVSVKEPEVFLPKINKIALIDFGYQKNILDQLLARRCEVKVFPAAATAEMIKEYSPDGIILSNGPGNPEDCTVGIETAKALMGTVPMLGICLGHQIMALAQGGETEKMKFGHRGANHPVRDLSSERCYITVQNHGYAVKADSIKAPLVVTHVNANDGTLEGLKYDGLKAFSLQFHPDATVGPNNTTFYFDKFLDMVEGK